MRQIFDNPSLFQRFGVTWRLGNLCIVGGLVLVMLGGLLFAVLFRHVGARSRRLTPYEAGHVMFDQFHQHHMLDNATGVGVDASIDIRGYRAAARDRDWLKFWLWPIAFTVGVVGIWAVICGTAIALQARIGVVLGIVSALLVFMLLVNWFMPLAALYTKIDSDPVSKDPVAKP